MLDKVTTRDANQQMGDMYIRTDLYEGDSTEILKLLPDDSVDLIVTSQPSQITLSTAR